MNFDKMVNMSYFFKGYTYFLAERVYSILKVLLYF